MTTPKYNPPSDPLVADVVSRLDATAYDDWEERAAIIEEGCHGVSRGHAEALALVDVLLRQPWWLTGLLAIQVEINGSTEWVLTTDPMAARQYFVNVGADEVAVLQPADVVCEQFDGVAMLTAAG